jgi:peptidoglycan-associated lipoprotein
MTGGSWEEPVNLKYPVNTPADDFAYVVDETTNDRGYLSSNREGGKGSDDIYSWVLPPLVFTVSGKVFDADTKANIEGASIELFGSDGTSIPYKTDKTGTYKFDLKPETKYRVSASMKEYLNKFLEVSTVGIEQSKDFVGDFELRSTRKPIVLPNILYDLAKWDLRPESKVALDELVQTMKDNPTIVIELGSHTDSRPIPMTNDTLSQRRAQSVVNYLIEKGIEADRLYAKGYGEREPRVLSFDTKEGFKAGDVLTDEYINKLKSKSDKEAAHQLNRRTEFKVLRNNYIKGQKADENMPAPGTNPDSTGRHMVAQEDTTPVQVEVKEKQKDTPVAREPGKIYVVEKKDTYMSVAKKFSITMKDLKSMNGIKNEPIYEGRELKVQKDGDYTDYDTKYYTLEKDDNSYSKVAKKLNLKSGDLKKLNKGVDEDTFHAGKRIRIAK